MKYTVLETDFGAVLLSARNGRLSQLDLFASREDAAKWAAGALDEAREDRRHFEEVASYVHRYFKGERVDFPFPVDLSGLGPFTVRVLEETRKVPYGRTASYLTIARRLGYRAARAVGQALKRNPIPLVVPCHRIVGSDGSLGGFTMGLDIKERLLSIEGVDAAELRKSMLLS